MAIAVNQGEVIQQVMRLLGVPKSATEFTLRVKSGELPEIDCTFYPEEKEEDDNTRETESLDS